MKCLNCEKSLAGKQVKWCSKKCGVSNANAKHQNYEAQQQRGRDRKLELIKIKGGSCEICGYKKSIAALSFHHLDPSMKNFELDLRSLSNRKWENSLEEAAKCQLVCLNCHMELHHGCEW